MPTWIRWNPDQEFVRNIKTGSSTSNGTTILGADDKSAIAIIIETLRVIHEQNLPHGPMDIVFTICEEIGLLGAKNLDFSLIEAQIRICPGHGGHGKHCHESAFRQSF